ncbi:MAG: serine hydrolase [Spirochaetales bacterium]|nr:serine hydrolase [Spirochaetales bacterium]
MKSAFRNIAVICLVYTVSFALKSPGQDSPGLAAEERETALAREQKNRIQEAPIDDPAVRQARDELLAWLESHTGPRYNAPNAVLVMVHKDRVIIKQAVKTTSTHVFNAASHTKLFTLLSIMQLADRGKIDIDKPLSEYMEEDLTRPEIGSAPVTIRHMLSHTSGYMWGAKQSFRTGYGYHYSNEGYNLLALLIEKVSGKPIAEYVKENIIDPLGMPYADPTEMKGAAFLRWSLEDMAIMLKLIHGRGKYNGKRIVKEKWFEREIYQPVQVGLSLARNQSYRGLAFRVYTVDERPFAINHAALTPGSGGYFQYYPQHQMGFILMTNSPTANLIDEIEFRNRGDREKEKEERANNRRFLPRVYLDPYFGAWYSSFTREVYKFMRVASNADINPADYKETSASPELAARYTGRYVHNDSSEAMEISATGANLFVEGATPGRAPLLASGPEKFYLKNNDIIFFIRSGERLHSLLHGNKLFVKEIQPERQEAAGRQKSSDS